MFSMIRTLIFGILEYVKWYFTMALMYILLNYDIVLHVHLPMAFLFLWITYCSFLQNTSPFLCVVSGLVSMDANPFAGMHAHACQGQRLMWGMFPSFYLWDSLKTKQNLDPTEVQ